MSPMTKLSRALEDVAQAKDALRSAIEAKERVEEQLTLRTKELHAERARADMMSEVADKLFDVIAVLRRP